MKVGKSVKVLFSEYVNPFCFNNKIIDNKNIIKNPAGYHAVEQTEDGILITLYDRKRKFHRVSNTKLKILLNLVKDVCSSNSITNVKFVKENLSHLHFKKFNDQLNKTFKPDSWTVDIDESDINPIVHHLFKNDFFEKEKDTRIFKKPYINVNICNTKTVALLDSGATCCVIDYDFVRKSNVKIDKDSENCKIYGVSGQTLDVKGICNISVGIGNCNFKQSMFVIANANLDHALILGCPFLERYGFSIDFHNKLVLYGDQKVKWLQTDSFVYQENNKYPLKLVEDITIPSRSSVEITLDNPIPFHDSSHFSFGHSNRLFKDINVHIKQCDLDALYNLSHKINVCLINHSGISRKLQRNVSLCDILGYVEIPVVSSHSLRLVNNDINNNIPNHLDVNDILEGVKGQENIDSFRNVIRNNVGVFAKHEEDIGEIKNYHHHIELKDSIPVACKPFRTPHSKLKIIDEEIEKMKRCGVIRESCSPYAAPCLIVYKKSGKPRLVVDFRRLNEKVVPIRYPLPHLESSLQLLGGNKWFTTLDLISGYHQIPLREEDKHKTAFSSGTGLYEFNRVPFGMVSSGAAMQYAMERVLAGLNNKICLTYIDDILVYGRTAEEHDKNLNEVLKRLMESGFKINGSKCTFRKTQVECLGHLISEDGITPHPSKIETFLNKSRPRNVKEVQSFIGLASYYRRFIPNFSRIAKPIVHLSKKDVKFKWDDDCQTAFDELKKNLSSSPILTFPDFEKPFIVTTDASFEGIGGVLTQIRDKKHFPIAYYSRTLNPAETRYSAYELEALAIKACLQKWRYYVLGYPVTVRSDNQPALRLLKSGNCENRMARFMSVIQEFHPQYEYIPGNQNNLADYMSRNVIDIKKVDDIQFSLPNEKELAKFQSIDPEIIKLRSSPKFTKINELIYYKDIDGLKLCIPNDQIQRYIKYFHCDLGHHEGVYRTVCRLKKFVYFPKLRKMISKYISSCHICKSAKPDYTRKNPLGEYPPCSKPFQRVHSDIIGPLPNAPGNFKYILVIQDAFSHLIIAEGLTKKDSNRVVNIFKDKLISKYSIPEMIVCDSGSEFTSNEFHEFCCKYNIQLHLCAPYHKASNGQVERANLQIELALRCTLLEKGQSWKHHLKNVVSSLNSTTHANLPYTPLEIVNNKWTTVDVPGVLNNPHLIHGNHFDLYKKIHNQLRTNQKQMKKKYDRFKKNKQIQLGDQVYYRIPDHKNKMKKIYQGPCKVIDKSSTDFSYVLLDQDNVRHKVHVNRIKV